MRFAALVAFSVIASFCTQVSSADSLGEYINALDSDVRTKQSALSVQITGRDKRPSLDSQRLLEHSHEILHTASPEQRQQISEAFIGLIPRYVAPANKSPIPNPSEYLAFMEVQVIYSEILDRAIGLQRAGWANGDKDLLDGAVRKLCSAPSTIEFYRRGLEQEIAAGRYPATAVLEAHKLRERLAQRNAWYLSSANLVACRDLHRVRVAP